MQAILAFLGSILGKTLTDNAIRWIAFKAIMTFLFIVILPIVLNNFLYDIMEVVLNFANDQSTTATIDGNMSFTGFMAWVMETFKIPECLSVISGALLMRLAISMVPFIRV